MKTRGKDYTRAQEQRAHDKWRKRLLNVWREPELADKPGVVDSLAKSMPKCSSPFCCGNPRRQRGTYNPTVQEMRWDL